MSAIEVLKRMIDWEEENVSNRKSALMKAGVLGKYNKCYSGEDELIALKKALLALERQPELEKALTIKDQQLDVMVANKNKLIKWLEKEIKRMENYKDAIDLQRKLTLKEVLGYIKSDDLIKPSQANAFEGVLE